MIQKHAELNSNGVVGILIWIFVLDMKKNDTCEKVFSRGVPFIRNLENSINVNKIVDIPCDFRRIDGCLLHS